MIALVEGFSWGPFVGSLINLAAVTVERYLRVVYPVGAKKNLRKWMIYSTAALAWFAGVAVAEGSTVPTLHVVDGRVCYPLPLWKSRSAQTAFGVWFFVSFYVVELLIFAVCYGRILTTVRRQARVMAAHAANTAGTTELNRLQLKIIALFLFY